MNKNILRFGTGGVPLSAAGRDTISGIKRINELGLEHMEVEFVHGVRMSKEKAIEVGKTASDLGVTLTIHAPYYINLNALDPQKREASRQRIMESCEIGKLMGVKSVCFHAAFNLSQKSEQVMETVLSEMIMIEDNLKEKSIDDLYLAPEITGKPTQFGSLEELIALANNLERTRLCVDFAHYFARESGKNNSESDFRNLIKNIKAELGQTVVDNLHMHFSGIEYSSKGEKNHVELAKTHFNWQGMLKVLHEEHVGGYLVCESPILEEDALKAKNYFAGL